MLLSLLFILLISRIDKNPLDTPSVARSVHETQEVSYLGKMPHTVDMSLFLIPYYFDLFTTQSVKYTAIVSHTYPFLATKDNNTIMFCNYIYHHRSNQVQTKVLLI
jgi:hypothetical protein